MCQDFCFPAARAHFQEGKQLLPHQPVDTTTASAPLLRFQETVWEGREDSTKNSAAVGAGGEFKAQIKEINPSDLQGSKKVLLCPFSAQAVNDIVAPSSYLSDRELQMLTAGAEAL